MEAAGAPPTVYAYSVLIKGYGRQERADGVRSTLLLIEKKGLRPDVVILNSAIDAFVRCGDWDAARHVLYNLFDKHQLRPNDRSYNPLLRSLAQAGRVLDAFKIRSDMIARGVQPTGVSLNALIHACVRANDLRGAVRLLENALQLRTERHGQEHVHQQNNVNVGAAAELTTDQCVAYTAVISGLASNNQSDTANRLLDDMVARYQLRPSPRVEAQVCIATTALVSALFKQASFVRAWTLFRSMRTRFSVRLTADAYTAVIRGLCQRRDAVSVDAAHRVFEEMYKVHLDGGADAAADTPASAHIAFAISVADMVTACNTMLDGLTYLGDMEGAEDLVTRMKKDGVPPDAVTHTTLITAYGRNQELASARRVFLDLRRSGLLPDRITMNALVSSCVHCGSRDLAVLIFEEMQRVGGHMSPNLTTYSGMIALFVRDNDMNAAWDAYEELKGSGLVPNERIMDRMMAACVSPSLRSAFTASLNGPIDMQPPTPPPVEVPLYTSTVSGSIEPAAAAAAVEAAWSQFLAAVPTGSELSRMAPIAGFLGKGWSSDRVATLLRDMETANVSERAKERWRAALHSVWSHGSSAS
jgi:pentatricopeptide repeat protein